jgi:hypothetical protein
LTSQYSATAGRRVKGKRETAVSVGPAQRQFSNTELLWTGIL